MSWKSDLAIGGGAVFAADFVGPKLPVAVDVGGLPVRKWGAAVGGAYAGGYFTGNKLSIMGALVRGAAALAAAELKTCYLPSVTFPVMGVDVARVAAGAAGVYGARKLGL